MSAILPTPLELGSIRLANPVASQTTRLPWQFTLMCWSVGLLILGLWITYAGAPPRVEVGEVFLFISAVIAAVPLVLRFFDVADADSETSVTDHLVAIAIVAALATGEYITAVLVPLVMDLGHLIEHYSILRSTSLIDGMKSLYSRPATLIEDGREIMVDPHEIRVGQTLMIRPGEMVVADGEVVAGHGSVDESAMTGESLPRDVVPGNIVRGGSICVNGQLQVAVTQTGDETTIGRVQSMLANAVLSKAPITRTLESYAQLYAPIVLLIAAGTLILTGDLKRVITVLVVSCPCSLILSGPLAMMIALSVASRHGILVKNAKFLETLAHVDTVVFDKTGTLTEGVLEVEGIRPWQDTPIENVLAAASICAATSRHPIARAVLQHALPRLRRWQTTEPWGRCVMPRGGASRFTVPRERFDWGVPTGLQSVAVIQSPLPIMSAHWSQSRQVRPSSAGSSCEIDSERKARPSSKSCEVWASTASFC